MNVIETIDRRTLAIVHFKEEEGRPMSRLTLLQAVIDPEMLSPSGEFIRMNHSRHSEVHGWVRVDSLVIDEILDSEFAEEKEREQLEAA